jgi:alpha-tubulin suppressor-like RCC1 family protein
LGNGTTTNASTPVVVTGMTTATAISAGAFYACALLADGTAKCWGLNSSGQLGNGTFTDSSTPVAVTGLTTATAITAGGGAHACALSADGTAKCWGYNGSGQLGNGTNIDSSTPVAVTGLTTASAIAAGGFHSCALLANGTVKCWGYNLYGQLGNGTNVDSSTPVVVTGF